MEELKGRVKSEISEMVWQLQSARIYNTWICWTKALCTTGREMQSLEPVTRRITNNTTRDLFNFQQIVIFQNEESCFLLEKKKNLFRGIIFYCQVEITRFFFKFTIASREALSNWVLNRRKSWDPFELSIRKLSVILNYDLYCNFWIENRIREFRPRIAATLVNN